MRDLRSERSQLPGQRPCPGLLFASSLSWLVPLHNFIYLCPLCFPICKITTGCLGNKGTEMKTNYYYCLCLTNAQGLKPLNGSNYFFFSYIKKWIIYLRESGLLLSSLSYLKDQKWALVSRHRLREFKHQLSSIVSKPSGISESAEIRC